MCKAPSMPKVKPPVRYAAEKAPSRAAIEGAGARMSAQVRSAQSTILTSPAGVTMGAPTEKKTLLGA